MLQKHIPTLLINPNNGFQIPLLEVVGNILLSESAISRKCEINLFRAANNGTGITSLAIDLHVLGEVFRQDHRMLPMRSAN